MSAALIAARFVHYGALTYLFGALLFPFYADVGEKRVGRRGGGARPPAGRAAAALAFVSGVSVFVVTVGGMADDPGAAFNGATLAGVVTGTAFGSISALRLVALAALAAAMTARADGRRPAALALATLSLASLAGVGHGQVGDGWRGPVHVIADAMHLLTAGLWIGALPLLVTADRAGDHQVVRRFSAVAGFAVAVLILTGVANTLFLVSAPVDLIWTNWGRLLIVKLALVTAMLALAAANRWRVTPMLEGIDAPQGAALVQRNARLELAAGAAVLAIVAVLGLLSPMPR